jgi:hypothetical protein
MWPGVDSKNPNFMKVGEHSFNTASPDGKFDYGAACASCHGEVKEFNRIPEKLKTIYHEMLHAYNNGSNLLCAIGIRTLIEGIVADKKIKGKGKLPNFLIFFK